MEGVLAVNAGEEFKLRATPDQELLRKLAYLAAQDSGSVLTGNARSGNTASKGADAEKAGRTELLLHMARLADPGYQALSVRINDNLDVMEEASVMALQQIEQELLELRRQRERMLEDAYRDEQGRAVFMNEDESAAYYEDGTRLPDDDFAGLKPRLDGKPTWDQLQAFARREEDLNAEREEIHRHEAEREVLREDLAEGAISAEEAERREQEIEASMPARVRREYNALTGQEPEPAPVAEADLSPEEAALLDVRSTDPAPSGNDENARIAGTVLPPPLQPG